MNRTLDGIVDKGLIEGIRLKFPDTVPSLDDRSYNIHILDMAKRRIKRLWKEHSVPTAEHKKGEGDY
jgi:hypothetical protein